MSDKDLTAPEAVERLARHTEKACKCEFDGIDVSAALRALSARVAELEALARRTTEERDHDKERAEAAEARVAEWRAEYETSDNMHKLYKRRCAELVSELNDAVAQAHDTGFERERWKARAEAAEAALADARDKERVSVKPLEWDASTAQAPFWTEYEVQKTDNGFWVAMLSGGRVARGLTSEAEAKAAAQADYERRILSALEPAPDHAEWDAAIEAAAKVIDARKSVLEVGTELSDRVRTLKKGPPQ